MLEKGLKTSFSLTIEIKRLRGLLVRKFIEEKYGKIESSVIKYLVCIKLNLDQTKDVLLV